MLCTNNISLLNSTKGKYSLRYDAPKEAPKYNPSSKNLLVVWDIFMQSWRTINCDNVDLINSWAEEDFWDIFNESFAPMSANNKIAFMNS